MSAITLISIIVIAILSIVIVTLLCFGERIILRSYKAEVALGIYDKEIIEEATKKKKVSASGIILSVALTILSVILIGLAIIAVIFKISGQQLVIKDHVALVIASDSMADYNSNSYKVKLEEHCPNAKDYQFETGDILFFTVVKEEEELKPYDVYGYKYGKNIITHRLVEIRDDGYLVFRGDNNPGEDMLITRDAILYHYNLQRVRGIGIFILFFGSYYGMYTLFAMILIFTISDIAIMKYEKINRERLSIINSTTEEESLSVETGNKSEVVEELVVNEEKEENTKEEV